MKKLILLLTAITLTAIVPANAQKYGHVNSQDILKAMPGVDSIEIQLKAYQEELMTMGQELLNEYNTKKDKFDKEAGTMSTMMRQTKEQELQNLVERIQYLQQNMESDLQEKSYSLQQPFIEKIQDAIKAVAEENHYTYIFDVQILLFYENGDDVTALVKKKLGIK
ncbi:MAG: OmpH family outer membrane protein [Bacteroidales bacterium]|nr:OmpH family outer membrane protein [Bacteroidales bacterium]